MQNIENRTLASTLFHLLSDEEWDALRAQMHPRSFQPGDVLVEQGALSPPFHVIVQGAASVVATSQQGLRRELGRLGFGEPVGEMALLTGEPASADVIAATEVKTYSATHEQLAQLGTLRSRLIEALSAILAGRLKHANERLLSLNPANIHVICCEPDDLRALGSLADAIRLTGSGKVLVLLSGEDMLHAAQESIGVSEGVTVQALPGSDRDSLDLAVVAPRLANEHGDVIIFAERAAIRSGAPDTTSFLHVTRANRGAHATAEHNAGGQLVAIDSQRWTQSALRQLSARYGAPVVAILPPDVGTGARIEPTARLARMMTHRQVGLALGAGSAKGLAHLGVLRALTELGIDIDVISGCSIGSAVAAGWASGLDVDELTQVVLKVASRAIRPTLPIRSFLSNRGLRDELMRAAGDQRLEDLEIPVSLVATDLFRRSEVSFTTGLGWPRVLASMALPGLYPPVAAMGSYLVDGGILSPVPVRQCRELGAGIVIGARLTGKRTSPRESLDFTPTRPFAIETISRSMEIMHNRISEMSNVQADVTIEACIEGGGMRDFQNSEPIIAQGYRAAMDAADALRALMPYVRESAA